MAIATGESAHLTKFHPSPAMRAALDYFRETHFIGSRCREHMLDSEHYPVLRNAPFIWIGHGELYPPYRMVRLSSVHSHIVACVSGQGRALIGGHMVDWKPGQVLLGPVGVHHAFEIAGRGPWQIAWVFFDDTESAPVLPGRQPELITADSADFVTALHMLTREAAGNADSSTLEALVRLLDTYARRLAGNRTVDMRLWRLWSRVEAELSHDWSVAEMAKHAQMSEEHLRRLCQKHLQRSPAEHLTHLRLRRAGSLLRSTPRKLEDIAQQVGYGSVYSFSTAFRRWSGKPPAQFRRS